jgi:hypothetical protein
MPVFYPNAGCIWLAGITRTALAGSKCRLFQDSLGVPTPTTTLADLVAAEADFSGYAEITITNFMLPYLFPGGGSAINSPSMQFMTADPTTVPNNIGGAWIETAGGVLVAIDSFPNSVPMNVPNLAIPLLEILAFGTGL